MVDNCVVNKYREGNNDHFERITGLTRGIIIYLNVRVDDVRFRDSLHLAKSFITD